MSTKPDPRGQKIMKRTGLLVAVLKICIILSVLTLNGPAREAPVPQAVAADDTGFSLKSIQARIQQDFADVRHMRATNLQILMEALQNVVVLDVREKKEYSTSHLADAVRVDPGISGQKFYERYAALIKDKIVIFYCSVGMRSSDLVQRILDDGHSDAFLAAYNLEGGIFNWHNEFRELVSEAGATRYVHPYNDYWGQLLKRRELLRYGLE